ncbi:ferritin family protein [Candidatus Bipolaricaulota bacterium]|nr:ferritin family protein [Candidatus Bipolaricaulota bacterium]
MTANDLLDSLRQAMIAERDGYQFYSMAAKQAGDPGAVEMFEHLAEEEMRHFNVLQKQYQSLLDTGAWVPEIAWDEPWHPEGAGSLFTDDFVRRIRGRHLEMAALSLGILLEKQAFEFYSRQAESAEDGSVREFFRELANWEDGHYRMLLREDEALKDEYWSKNRFEPLV